MERAIISDFMNGDDIGVIQSGSGARFLLKATQPLGVFGEEGRKELECHLATQNIVLCQVNFAHAACTQQGNNPVVADCSLNH